MKTIINKIENEIDKLYNEMLKETNIEIFQQKKFCYDTLQRLLNN